MDETRNGARNKKRIAARTMAGEIRNCGIFFDILPDEVIAQKTGVLLSKVKEVKAQQTN